MQEANSKEGITRMVFLFFSFPCILWVSFYFIIAIILMYLRGFGKLGLHNYGVTSDDKYKIKCTEEGYLVTA